MVLTVHGVVLAAWLNVPGGLFEALLVGMVLLGILALFSRVAGRGFAAAVTGGALLGYVVAAGIALPIAVLAVGAVAWAVSSRGGRSFRQPARPFLAEGLLVLGGLALYELARMATEGGFEPAKANALRVIDLERGMGLFFEPSLQDFVLRSDIATRLFNTFYSFGFLAITAAVLVWLYLADRPNYRLFRNCLGISAALATVTLAIFPVAPPRMIAEAGLVDTVVAMGREHSFANDYAAVPSLHVGWMVLVTFVLARSIRGWRGLAIGLPPSLAMSLTVITTGNHYWLDGVVGSAYAVGPALLFTQRQSTATLPRLFRDVWRGSRAPAARACRAALAAPTISGKARFTSLCLTGLLTYLIAGEIVAPGFTDFWGYMVFQMAVTMVLLLGAEVVFAREGGLSWQTHIIAIAESYGDVLGTAGGLYASIDEYDKLTHFAGVAAITSGVYDALRALSRRGVRWRVLEGRLFWAVAFGVAIGIGWEVYELLGDKVFHTTRVQGKWDTTHDLISDTLGALTAGFVLWWSDRPEEEQETETAWP